MNRVLAVRGRVVPATGAVLTLHARLDDGSEVSGQSRIAKADKVDRVWVTPEDCRPTEDALRAIADAELIVLGPGSLFTSILPVLLVPGIAEAIEASGALVVYACNVATQPGETGGFDLADHLDALGRHGAGRLPDVVLGNNRFNAAAPHGWVGEPVRLRWPPAGGQAPRLVLDDLVDPDERAPPRPSGSRRPSCPPGCARAGTGAGPRSPAPGARPDRTAMAGTDRDLVAALRAELAAVDPSRACDRNAEIAGLGPDR